MTEKRLRRSSSDTVISGVCAGLADYFGLDPAIIRLIFVVLFLAGTIGFWPYLILWLVMPEE